MTKRSTRYFFGTLGGAIAAAMMRAQPQPPRQSDEDAKRNIEAAAQKRLRRAAKRKGTP